MTIKKDAQLAFEECYCAEMMAQVMPQTKEQQSEGDACSEMMAQFGRLRVGVECLEMMSRRISVCCDAGQESDETVSSA